MVKPQQAIRCGKGHKLGQGEVVTCQRQNLSLKTRKGEIVKV